MLMGDLSYCEFHYQKQLTLWMVEWHIKDTIMVSDQTWKVQERKREQDVYSQNQTNI